MQLLDSLEIVSQVGKHSIELYHGDLTNMSSNHAVDVLVVSAFPNDYSPVPMTLIGALSKIGVSVHQLSRYKAADLRDSFSCWMSREITTIFPDVSSRVQFKRVLVFEPLVRGRPSDVVSDIFQSLMPFVYAEPFVKSIAMPLVATGNQGVSPERIFAPLLHAAVNWFLIGLPVEVIKIVEQSEAKALQLKGAFALLKQQYSPLAPPNNTPSAFRYDYFISYSHNDYEDVDFFCKQLTHSKPELRVFMDRHNLEVGAAWQQELYESLDNCAKVIAIYSPSYLKSKVCKEEYNIALMRHREEGSVLVPLYLRSTKLPTYMRLIQFIDCREGDKQKLIDACNTLLQ